LLCGVAATVAASHTSRAEQPAGAPRQRSLKIALPDFNAASSDVADVAQRITRIVTDDLRSSGNFTLIDDDAMPAIDIDGRPQFDAWRALDVEVLVNGGVKAATGGRLSTQFRLWDIAAGLPLSAAQYFTAPERWRQVGHVIAGTIYQHLGEARDFGSGRD
jgi:TolB protein